MCMGFAILANKKEVKYKENNSSHSVIGTEDDYIKLEVVMNASNKCGYTIQEDENIDSYCKKIYTEKGLYLKGKPHPDIMKLARKWCKENELIIFKAFAFGNLSGATLNRQDNNSAEIKEQDNSSAEIKEQYNYSAQIKEQDNDSVEIKNQYNNSAEINQMIIYNLKIRDKHTTNLIKRFSENRRYDETTLSNFVKWLERRVNKNV